MTINISNTELSSTWDFWRGRTNDLAYAMSHLTLTVNSNAAIGDAAVIGSFRANTIYTDAIRGGSLGNPGPLSIASNTTFDGNVTINGSVSLSYMNGVDIIGTASANTTAGVTGISSNSMYYGSLGVMEWYSFYGNGAIYNKGDVQFEGFLTVGNSTVNTYITPNSVSVNGHTFTGSYYDLSDRPVIITTTGDITQGHIAVFETASTLKDGGAPFGLAQATSLLIALAGS